MIRVISVFLKRRTATLRRAFQLANLSLGTNDFILVLTGCRFIKLTSMNDNRQVVNQTTRLLSYQLFGVK